MGRINLVSATNDLNDLLSSFLLKVYPVGSYYWSMNSSSPETLFGGTWERIEGYFILAADNAHPVQSTGGTSAINLSHTHTTSGHTLSLDEIPNHVHRGLPSATDVNTKGGWGSSIVNVSTDVYCATYEYDRTVGGGKSHTHGNTGSSLSTVNTLPPYIAAYCWRRIA